jgi:hypothetical protein
MKGAKMKIDQKIKTSAIFSQLVSTAVSQLKLRLKLDYEQAYPELREIVHLVLNEEESKAWELSSFPHLLLPDLVEAHIAKLNLPPAETRHADAFAAPEHDQFESNQQVYALCA